MLSASEVNRLRGKVSWVDLAGQLVGLWAGRIGMLFWQSVVAAWLWNSYVVVWYGAKFSLPVVPYTHVFVIACVWVLFLNLLLNSRK